MGLQRGQHLQKGHMALIDCGNSMQVAQELDLLQGRKIHWNLVTGIETHLKNCNILFIATLDLKFGMEQTDGKPSSTSPHFKDGT
jgi:hypothetical protein